MVKITLNKVIFFNKGYVLQVLNNIIKIKE